ncbi:MAG: glycosyltransferase family 2 protein [Alphaproteobacteria bacterium]|nr:glycosyltransferase family 2 protein [Alphaproteobacteria bacterium]
MLVAIIIPAHNEERTVAAVVRAVAPHGAAIVVDDGSADRTAEFAEAAGARVVHHARNRGYDDALQSGFEEAARIGADAAVTFDADGQHDAAILGRVLAPIATGQADLVIGVRPKAARISERLFNRYTRARFAVPDILCGLKAYRMTLFHSHGRFGADGSIGTELALASLARGARFQLVAVPIAPRVGKSRFGSALWANWRILKALLRAVRGHTSGQTFR